MWSNGVGNAVEGMAVLIKIAIVVLIVVVPLSIVGLVTVIKWIF